MLYERTALSKKPSKLVALELKKLRQEDKLTPELVFRDPYFLDFLGLKGAYQEKDLEEIELLKLDKSGIRVAEYMTELPPRKILEKKLHEAIRIAREHLA